MTVPLLFLLLLNPLAANFPNLASKKDQSIHPSRINATVKAVARVRPAVINIIAERKNNSSPFSLFGGDPAPQKQRVLGTGIIFDKRGYAITNEHVIAGATKIEVTLANKKKYTAKVVGADRKLDIAVLKINCKKPLPMAVFGTSRDLMPGETVIAIGSPHGFSFTISKGVISATHRNVLIDTRVYGDAIQTDAAINPGNSGGPLINILGEVIAINSFKRKNASNMGFAIPIDKVKTVAQELLIHKKVRAIYLGMTVKESPGGIYVTSVEKGSPIEKAGIRPGVRLLKIKNYTIGNLSEFGIIISTLIVGEKTLFITSAGNRTVTVGKLSSAKAYSRFVNYLGIRLRELKSGLAIHWIDPRGRAYRMGLRIGDILKTMNSKPLVNKKTLAQVLLAIRHAKSLYTTITRNGYDYPLVINY
ncbi:trypsin-like peptidase domain-containing protein [Myxococcota bacterium]|nr:trypsin-like peptidase domain-containing protein [Myxococcota bacterium]MBU1536134.1 trypsin-like peptidase domain-containing protein [Myxococcota bacterium]